MKKLILLLLLTFLLVFCRGNVDSITKLKENGVEVIINHLAPYRVAGEKVRVVLKEEFSIDSEKEDIAKLGLNDIWGLNVDSRGNIFIRVQRAQDKFIFRFDAQGRYVSSFARKGQGPGEIQSIRFQTIDPHDRLIILDNSNQRMLLFSGDGTIMTENYLDPNTTMLLPLESGDYLINKVIRLAPSGDELSRTILCDPSFQEIRELERRASPISSTGAIKGLLPISIWKVSRNRIYIGSDDKGYDIHVFNLKGELIKKIKKEFRPVEVPEEIKSSFLKMYDRPDLAEIRMRIYFPEYLPPFQYFFNDEDGRLFVMTNEKGKTPKEYIYDIFNSDGVLIGRMSLDNYGQTSRFFKGPLAAVVRGNHLYSIREKDSGFKELVVYRMEWQ